MTHYKVIEQMTYSQLFAKMVAESDIKLHHVLSDIDPFWNVWGYWMEELNKKAKDGEELK